MASLEDLLGDLLGPDDTEGTSPQHTLSALNTGLQQAPESSSPGPAVALIGTLQNDDQQKEAPQPVPRLLTTAAFDAVNGLNTAAAGTVVSSSSILPTLQSAHQNAVLAVPHQANSSSSDDLDDELLLDDLQHLLASGPSVDVLSSDMHVQNTTSHLGDMVSDMHQVQQQKQQEAAHVHQHHLMLSGVVSSGATPSLGSGNVPNLMAAMGVIPTSTKLADTFNSATHPISPLISNSHLIAKSDAPATLKVTSSANLTQLEQLPAHEQSLQAAESSEEQLLMGAASGLKPEPLAEVTSLLQGAAADWNSSGRPDASGAMIGGSVALKFEELSAVVPELAQQWQQVGRPRVLACTGPIIAIGTALGVTRVLQLPAQPAAHPWNSSTSSAAAGTPASTATSPQLPPTFKSSTGGSYSGGGSATAAGSGTTASSEVAVMHVGDARNEAEAVTALGFSHVVVAGDAMWLLVGHSSGTMVVWDLQKRPARQVASVSQHGLPLTHVSFFPGRGTSPALSIDRRGRAVLTFFTNMVLKTAVTSRVVLDGTLGQIGAVAHLPSFMTIVVAAAAAASTTPVATVGGKAAGGSSSSSSSSQAPAVAGAPCAGSEGSGSSTAAGVTGAAAAGVPTRVGDGVVALCTLTGVHIVRFRQSGELLQLYCIPPVEGAVPGCLPACAWMPAGKRGAISPARAKVVGEVRVPCAVLAVAWGRVLATAEIPLLGDHVGVPAGTPVAPTPANAITETAAAAARRSLYAAVSSRVGSVVQPLVVDTMAPATLAYLSSHVAPSLIHAWRPGPTHGRPHAQAQQQSISGFPEDAVVLGLHWYDSEALGVVLQQGLCMRLLVVDNAMEVREQVECLDSPHLSGLLSSSIPSVPDTLVGHGARVLLLGSSGTLYCSRLMNWQERLKTLQDIGKWRLGLWYALEFFRVQRQRVAADATSTRTSSSSGARSSTSGFGLVDSSQAEQLRAWLMGLLLGYVHDSLDAEERARAAVGPTHGQTVEAAAVVQAAQVAVWLCVALNRLEVLTDPLFQWFRTAGSSGPFLEALQPAILGDCLRSLAPEVMQAFVEHVGGVLGRPDQVERCVLHLDVFSMDLDQVLRLCEAHGLYSALLYVYNRIQDYRKPALDLLAATAFAHTHQQRLACGYKLLVYLRCIFRHRSFPPGSGALPLEALAYVDDIKAQLLGSLLFFDTSDLAREWHRDVLAVQAKVIDPHPALQVLLSVDVAATVSVLGGAVEGWDAMETELRAAAGRPTEELASVRVATQVLVDALVRLLQSGRFVELYEGQQAAVASPHLQQGPAGLGAAMDFIIRLLAAGRVTVEPAFGLQLLQHNVQQATTVHAEAADIGHADGVITAAAPAVLSTTDVQPVPGGAAPAGTLTSQRRALLPAAAQQGVLERLFLSVVQALGVAELGSRPAPHKLSQSESEVVLQLAATAGFTGVLPLVHHLRGDYAAALAVYMQQGQQAAPFDYIRSCASDRSLAPPALARLRSAIVSASPVLITLDPVAAAEVVDQHFSGDEGAVVAAVGQQPALQHAFLKAALERAQARRLAEEVDNGQHVSAAVGSRVGATATASASSISISISSSSSSSSRLFEHAATAELYIQLMCKFEPQSVLPFLVGHHKYDVRRCIAYCRQAGVTDAEAYLHERLGELDAALRLYLAQVTRCNAVLKADVLSGKINTNPIDSPETTDGSYSNTASNPQAAAFARTDVSAPLQTNAQVPAEVPFVSRRQSPSAAHALEGLTGRLAAAAFRDHDAGAVAADSSSPGMQEFDSHFDWLCSLSPRMHLVLLRVIGTTAAGTARQPMGRTLSVAGCIVRKVSTNTPSRQASGSTFRDLLQRQQAASGGGPAALLGAGSSNANASGSEVPQELLVAWQALQAAVAFCQRSAKQAKVAGDSKAAHSYWFQLLHQYVLLLQQLQRLQPAAATIAPARPGTPTAAAGTPRSLPPVTTAAATLGAAGGVAMPTEAHTLVSAPETHLQSAVSAPQLGAAPAAASLTALPTSPHAVRVLMHITLVFMEQVVSCTAEHMPLHLIVTHITSSYGHECFGEFRGILLGLFSAVAYEQAIMACANRLVTRDVFGQVRQSYRLRATGAPPVAVTVEQADSIDHAQVVGSVSPAEGAAGIPSVHLAGSAHSTALQAANSIGRRNATFSPEQLPLAPAGLQLLLAAKALQGDYAAVHGTGGLGKLQHAQLDALNVALLHRQQHSLTAWQGHGGSEPGSGALSPLNVAEQAIGQSELDVDDLLQWTKHLVR